MNARQPGPSIRDGAIADGTGGHPFDGEAGVEGRRIVADNLGPTRNDP